MYDKDETVMFLKIDGVCQRGILSLLFLKNKTSSLKLENFISADRKFCTVHCSGGGKIVGHFSYWITTGLSCLIKSINF